MNKFFLVITVVFIALLLTGCSSRTAVTNAVTVSILPQKYLVEHLLNDSVEVNVMVSEGNSPTTYSPTPSQLRVVSQSSLYLKIGYIGFEQAWMDRIKSVNSKIKIVDTSKGISLIREEDENHHDDHFHEGGVDPHIWTSPKTMLQVLKNTQEALISEFPNQKADIESNGLVLEKRISALDSLFIHARSEMKSNKFIIFHPAYTYLARDYDLIQVSIEHLGKEPSAKWLKEITDLAKEQGINAIFIQKEFDKRNAEIIAKEIGMPIVEVNPLSELWEVEMNSMLNKLKQALR